jgi:tetratricopeptide (TPR) repeat protein
VRITGLLLCLLALGLSPARAADNWVKVRSPHFTVLSNGSEKQARDIAAGFEQIHAVFAQALPGLRTDSGAETIVIAPKDERTFVQLVPWQKKQSGHIAGEFHKGWEKDFVIVRLDVPEETRNTVYHEYIHKLLHLNFTRMPVWLDEGLAEFFGNTQFRSNQTLIGVPSPRIGVLRGRTPYPLQTILTVGPASPYYHDEDKVYMFYAESWALTHFLMFGNDMGNGQRINAYITQLQKGADAQKSFEETIGNVADVEKQFLQYINRYAFSAFVYNKPLNVDSSTFVAGGISEPETDAYLASLYVASRELDMAGEKLAAALKGNPQSALAHENMGFLDFQQGKDEEAGNEFHRAAELNPDSYLALYYQAMLAYHGKNDPDSLANLDLALQRVLQLNPRFAPAVIARSHILVRQQKFQDAYNLAVQAQKLEPDRGGYQTNVAAILLLANNYADAIRVAGVVAERWAASDSAEALAVVDQARYLGKLPATSDEQAKEAYEMKYAEGTTPLQGVIKSVTCEKSKPLGLVLQSGGKEMSFQATTKGFGYGYSDTIWYGTDHFSPCYHLQGTKALVRYKGAPDSPAPVEMQWLEIRDELIPTSAPPAVN